MFPWGLCGYALLGDKPKAKGLLEKALNEKGKARLSPYWLSLIDIALGDYNEALQQLEKAFDTCDLHMFYIKVDPLLDPIWNQPRFKEVLKKMGLQ